MASVAAFPAAPRVTTPWLKRVNRVCTRVGTSAASATLFRIRRTMRPHTVGSKNRPLDEEKGAIAPGRPYAHIVSCYHSPIKPRSRAADRGF